MVASRNYKGNAIVPKFLAHFKNPHTAYAIPPVTVDIPPSSLYRNAMDAGRLKTAAIAASRRAYAPYSSHRVGASLATDDGELYCGCNIENASYGATVCAERSALFNMISGGHRCWTTMYIYTEDGHAPCGLCRQVMSEFSSKNARIVMVDARGTETATTLKELFPLAFSLKR